MSIEAIFKYFRGSIKSKFNLGNYNQKYLQTETFSLVVIDISQKEFLYLNIKYIRYSYYAFSLIN